MNLVTSLLSYYSRTNNVADQDEETYQVEALIGGDDTDESGGDQGIVSKDKTEED